MRIASPGALDVLAATWLVGGALLALGLLELAWDDGLSGVFALLSAAGGATLAAGLLLLPVAARGRGSLLAVGGIVLAVVGVAMAWFGGYSLLPPAVVLYAAGLVRAGLLSRPVAVGAVAVLAGAVALAWFGAAGVIAAELAVLSAIAVGAALALRRRLPQRA
jgi:hypothetical protein